MKITSLQHPLVKNFVRLREDRRYRYETKRVVVSGIKLIKELAARMPLRTLLLGEECDLVLPADKTYIAPMQVLKKATGLENPEPIAAEVDMPDQHGDFSSFRYLLVLDGIADPGNLGTLLRTALALGWDGAYITDGSADPYNEKALRAAKGATFLLPWKRMAADALVKELQDRQIPLFAADAQGQDVGQLAFASPMALALGNEAHGIALELRQAAKMIAIPMTGAMESLNVAGAGAILMHAMRRGL